MLTAGRWFVRLGPEVRSPDDQPVSELEKRHRVIGTAIEKPLEPRYPVTLVGNRDFRPQMPVTGILLIEPQVAITPPDTLPRLRDLVDHGWMQQPCPDIPVPGLQARDEALRPLPVAP